jgi:hypothetical protein
MIIKSTRLLFFIFFLYFPIPGLKANDFTIVNKDRKACIIYDSKGPAIDSITAHLLAEDIQRVTGYLPSVVTDLSMANGNVMH